MNKVTRCSVRFFVGEFDDDGNLLRELPVAAGNEEFNATIYYPFTLPLAELITAIEGKANGVSEAQRDGAPGSEPGLQTGVRGVRGEALGEAPSLGESACQESGDEDCRAQDPEADGGGPHQAPGEGWDQFGGEPPISPPKCQPQQRRSEGIIVRQCDEDTAEVAAGLLCASAEEEGRRSDRYAIWEYLISEPFQKWESVCFVAYVKGIAVGIIIGKWHRETHEPYYEVDSLYVTPMARGGSVAKRLIEAAVDWAGEDDAPVYIATKGEARDFYTSLGFAATHRLNVSTLNTVRDRLRT